MATSRSPRGQAGGKVARLYQPVIDRMAGESGPGEKKAHCEDVFEALVRRIDAKGPSYKD